MLSTHLFCICLLLSESYDQAYVQDGKLVLIAEKVNGITTLVYPNLHLTDENVKKQWPFDTSFYLILNYALGGAGTWPGVITDSELPAKRRSIG